MPYKIAAKKIADLDVQVNDMLERGFELHDSPFVSARDFFCQAPVERTPPMRRAVRAGGRGSGTVVRWFLAMLVGIAATALAKIPTGYEIGDHTLSPDGRHAILFPTKAESDDAYPPNLLVRLEPYAVLAVVAEPGLPEGVTTDLLAKWHGNSTVAVWQFRRWGIVDLRIYEIADGRVTRTHDVWTAVREAMRRDFRERFLTRFPDESETIIFVSSEGEENPEPEFEFRERTLRIATMADNKPNLAPGPFWSAELRAVWNLDTGRLENVRLKPGPIGVRTED